MRYTVAIPTMNRPEDLRQAIACALQQQPRPEAVLVVDDGALDVEPFRRLVEGAGVRWEYERKPSPGLVASLNRVADLTRTPWVLILDDDVFLEPDFMARMMEARRDPRWRRAGGYAGYVVQPNLVRPSGRQRLRRVIERVFLLAGGVEGRYFASGYCTDHQLGRHPSHPYPVQHVPGGLGLWRVGLLRRLRFSTPFTGYGYANDKDFALRAARHVLLVGVPAARAEHRKSAQARLPSERLGRMKVINQHMLFQRHRRRQGFHPAAFWWATLGLFLLTVAGAATAPNAARWQEVRGMASGIAALLGFGSRHAP